MKKLLLVLSLCGVVGLQASSSDFLTSDRAKSVDSGVLVSSDASDRSVTPPEDSIISITLERPLKSGKMVVEESVRQLQFKYANMRALIGRQSHFVYQHDRNHMVAILDYAPEGSLCLIAYAEAIMIKYGNQKKAWQEPNVAVKNFEFLNSLEIKRV